ncbi:putative cytochrome P450 [Leptodontidium sp. MPI-SDFR-AT-0119]|nr:putative cytochrome P450 [Leptodontidium sp. MPI-SDFR-AT-0119]
MNLFTSNVTASFTPNMDPDSLRLTTAAWLPGVIATGFFLFLCFTPRVKKGSPQFTKEKYPVIGSYKFFTHKWFVAFVLGLPQRTFWKSALLGSKTGNFSFWLGKNHVVGVSGEAARKMYLDHRDMDHIKGVVLIGHGPDYINGRSTTQHGIWLPVMAGNKSYAQRNVLSAQKTAELTKRLPNVTRDARLAFEAVAKPPYNGIANPAHLCCVLTWMQGTRVFGCDEIIDDPKLRAQLLTYLPILQRTSSCHLLAFPWASYFSISYWKRQYGRWGMRQLVTPIVNKRMAYGAEKIDDPIGTMIDNGDSADYIINYLISMIFISSANGCVISGAMLYCMAHHQDWQEKVYNEIKAVANAVAKDKSASLIDQLDSLSVKDWENMSASLDLCYKECIRMWVAFPMGRMNEGTTDIKIPGTNEIIPAGGLACYNTIDVHYNEKLYPQPLKWDPARFGEGRKEMEQEAYGFMGWGGGRHPCNGIRWAKIQQNMMLAYALGMYKWTGCFPDGSPNPEFIPPTTALNELAPALPQNLFCKAVPREKA